MKKTLIIGTVLTILSLSNVAAQDSVKVKTAVIESFKRTFHSARKAKFESFKGIHRVQFQYMDGHLDRIFRPHRRADH